MGLAKNWDQRCCNTGLELNAEGRVQATANGSKAGSPWGARRIAKSLNNP
jgi:hypothetical protein